MISLYNKYKNIMLFSSDKYRNFKLEEPSIKEKDFYSKPKLNFNEFVKLIQLNEYIIIKGKDNNKNEKIFLLIIKPYSKYSKQTAQMYKIIKKIKKEPSTIFIFTKDVLSVYIRKALKNMLPMKFKNYNYKHFIIEINKGPLCSKYKILTEEETEKLCNEILYTGRLNLPKIYNSDPQIIWIGAEEGDVVKIYSNSLITGPKITYRVVYPEKNW